MDDSDSTDDVRASVLEAALELGVTNEAVAKWFFEDGTSSDSRPDESMSAAKVPNPDQTSDIGHLGYHHRPAARGAALDHIYPFPSSMSEGHGTGSYYFSQGGFDSSSESSHSHSHSFYPSSGPSSASSYDTHSPSSYSHDPLPTRTRMPYKQPPYAYPSATNGPKIFQPSGNRIDHDAGIPSYHYASSPIYAPHRRSSDTLDSDPFHSTITKAAVSTSSLVSNTNTVKQSKSAKLKKSKPDRVRDGYTSDGSVISHKSKDKKKSKKKSSDDLHNGSSQQAMPSRVASPPSVYPLSASRPRTQSESRSATKPGPFLQSTSPTEMEADLWVRTNAPARMPAMAQVQSSQRPGTAPEVLAAGQIAKAGVTKKQKSFRWGFKRSQSHPELPTVAVPRMPPTIDIPPLPALQLPAEFSSAGSISTSTRSIKGSMPPNHKVHEWDHSDSGHSLEGSWEGANPEWEPPSRADLFNQHGPPSPALSDRNERMRAWVSNRANSGDGGAASSLFFSSRPSGESIRSGRSGERDTPDPKSRSASRSRLRVVNSRRNSGNSDSTLQPPGGDVDSRRTSVSTISPGDITPEVNGPTHRPPDVHNTQGRKGSVASSSPHDSPTLPSREALAYQNSSARQKTQHNKEQISGTSYSFPQIIASFGPSKTPPPAASKPQLGITTGPSQTAFTRSRSRSQSAARKGANPEEIWEVPGSADFTLPSVLTSAVRPHVGSPDEANVRTESPVSISKVATPNYSSTPANTTANTGLPAKPFTKAFPAPSSWKMQESQIRPSIIRRPSDSSTLASLSSRSTDRPRSFAGSTRSSVSAQNDDLYEALRNTAVAPPPIRDPAIPPPSPPPSSPLPPRPSDEPSERRGVPQGRDQAPVVSNGRYGGAQYRDDPWNFSTGLRSPSPKHLTPPKTPSSALSRVASPGVSTAVAASEPSHVWQKAAISTSEPMLKVPNGKPSAAPTGVKMNKYQDLAKALSFETEPSREPESKSSYRPRPSTDSTGSKLSDTDVPDYYYSDADANANANLEQSDAMSDHELDPRLSRLSDEDRVSLLHRSSIQVMNAPILQTGKIPPIRQGVDAHRLQPLPSLRVEAVPSHVEHPKPTHRRKVDVDSFLKFAKNQDQDQPQYLVAPRSPLNPANPAPSPTPSSHEYLQRPSPNSLPVRTPPLRPTRLTPSPLGAQQPRQPPRSALAAREASDHGHVERSLRHGRTAPTSTQQNYWL